MYDHTKLIRQGDNPNKETIIDIPNPAYSHCLVVPAEKLVYDGGNPINRLAASVPSRAPTRSTIRYLQYGCKPNNGVVLSCGGYPVNGAVSRMGHIVPTSEYGRNSVEGNYRGFIRPWVQMRGACKACLSEWRHIP